MLFAILVIAHARAFAAELQRRHLLGFIHREQAGAFARLHQVARDFGLAIDHHALAAGEFMQVYAMALAAKQQFDAVVRQAFGAHARIGLGLGQQIHRDLFEHPGADAAQHIVGAALLQDDVVDSCFMQQLSQKQACGAGADDCHLCTHLSLHQGCLPLA